MAIKGKKAFFIAVAVVAILPVMFLAYFVNKKQPEISIETVLPIYGNRTPNEYVNQQGETVIDTIYHTVPSFSMINQIGDTITQNRMRGIVSVVDFFFTSCPDICVDMAKNKHKIQEEFIKDKSKINIFSFTVNPKSDTQEKLLQYAYDNDVNSNIWNLLTGDKPDIYNLARKGFLVTATEGDGGPTDFIHDNKFVLIDREMRIRGFYDGTSEEDVDRLIIDAKKLLVSYIVPRKKGN